jgi:hypothetical protein
MSLEHAPARQGHNGGPPLDDFITIADACRVIGGSKPISKPTYYRGAAAGHYPKPRHPSPGISRILRVELETALGITRT